MPQWYPFFLSLGFISANIKIMKHSYFIIQSIKQPARQVYQTLSSGVFLSIFLSVGVLITGLLYSACASVSKIEIASAPMHTKTVLEKHMESLVDGYPIKRMIPYIATHNQTSVAFLVAIAKKESNWGKRVPVDEEGKDCYNYWGYRGAGSRGIEMGHGCFGSPKEAIRVVGARIDTLVNKYGLVTPEEFIVWKCGWNCDGHSNESVSKWISDVDIYFDKVNKS
ncbi:MAG: hypothetical protein COZ86_04760 [Candidatus Moranbacteria bacterium CG_4_8_14_3_um_filter_41_13]|nr:MAG: hypothetical protein COX32_02940 [Candidatus Moranbacteria bacterium CG23_combo_of_CG06-09_8_20_14_all_41_28]PIV85947.1 MAG: hypothetical protein COW50_04240 [Candidatus Moranbacteria bacterium CG17_big_fil_post_rev_8_21_14_2_50_41_107]PIW93751.1 MAG: hypothetical protein COZ86_04760 [Candidatus Moranbacteria bacterium CG_4_8_14_3_um_filter_41_13]PJC00344.1 MAG: hypothetical protein CO075_01090 [Candidatus Moranbacteria bacterium CG_4_9_14_0_8_um_filter_41_43]HCJ45906.1 hypothetical pro